jgi:hypothetical protein
MGRAGKKVFSLKLLKLFFNLLSFITRETLEKKASLE